jgi:Ca2+-binding EF-hand superfamily protein
MTGPYRPHKEQMMTPRRLILTVSGMVALGGLMLPETARANETKAGGPDMFQMMDTDRDGKISPAEHAAGSRMMFQKMDANHDGKVTAAEMDVFHAKMAVGQKATPMTMSSAEKIKAIDTNGDGALSAEEHAAGSKMMFDKMDTDKDGYLSKAELEAGHAKMMTKPAAK